jgi:hypothetical protein
MSCRERLATRQVQDASFASCLQWTVVCLAAYAMFCVPDKKASNMSCFSKQAVKTNQSIEFFLWIYQNANKTFFFWVMFTKKCKEQLTILLAVKATV